MHPKALSLVLSLYFYSIQNPFDPPKGFWTLRKAAPHIPCMAYTCHVRLISYAGWRISSKTCRTGVTHLFETESYFLVQIHAKGCQFDTHTSEIKICTIYLHIMLSLIIKTKDIRQCEDTDHVHAVVRTGPWATHMVRTGDLVPAGTMLVTPGVE